MQMTYILLLVLELYQPI